jgi:hypothetical protein
MGSRIWAASAMVPMFAFAAIDCDSQENLTSQRPFVMLRRPLNAICYAFESVAAHRGELMRIFERLRTIASGCLIAAGFTAHSALGDYISSDYDQPSPTYHSDNPVTYSTPAGDITIDLFTQIFSDSERSAPPAAGQSETISFSDIETLFDLYASGAPPVHVRQPNTRATLDVDSQLIFGPYRWQYVDYGIKGNGIPGGCPPNIQIRESPTLPSSGQTSVTAGGDGLFRISSFFDVFTELSIDGGITWTPGSNSMHLEGGPAIVTPEPSSCVLWLFGLIAVSYVGRRRRRACM